MIKINILEHAGIVSAIRGMRNPMNSWDKSDTQDSNFKGGEIVGPNDLKLMKQLAAAGPDHRKFMRMICVWMDITAPLYWWKEFDTYKVGTVANSCSTMHKIHSKHLTIDDFSCEHLSNMYIDSLQKTIKDINYEIDKFNEKKYKENWNQIIQLLPSSYNQTRTVMLNYETLANMYYARKSHKLGEWRELCRKIEELPLFEVIHSIKED